MANAIVKQSLLHPELDGPIDLLDEINRRTLQASAICRLAANSGHGDLADPLIHAMWCVECLLNDVEELAELLKDHAYTGKSAVMGSAEARHD